MNTAIATLIALRDGLKLSSSLCNGKPGYENAKFVYDAMIPAVQAAIDMLKQEQQK